MSAVRHISDTERRARVVNRHHLAPRKRGNRPIEVARDLVGLHASDPASVFLAIAARTKGVDIATIESILYDDHELVRVLCMRRTVFTVPLDLLPVVHAGCTLALLPGERRRFVQMVEQAGIATDGARWLRSTEAATVKALDARGEAFATDLSKDVPALRKQISFGDGSKKWHGQQGVSTRVLWTLASEGRIVRGRPRGGWTSSQHQWAPMLKWLPGGIEPMDPDAARTELVRRWLRSFGPGTTLDLRWWTGWTATAVAKALSAVGAVEVALDGGANGWVLADDIEPVPRVTAAVALLPALDPTAMGWTGRAWYLGDHAAHVFDRNGNVGPTVWWNGRVVGGWAQRPDGDVVYRLLDDIGSAGTRAVEREAERLTAWIGPARVKPRFRTPLELELSR
jgi:hypothetical protein